MTQRKSARSFEHSALARLRQLDARFCMELAASEGANRVPAGDLCHNKLGRREESRPSIGAMSRLLFVLGLVPLAACLQLGTPGDAGAGAAGAGAANAGAAGASSSDAGLPAASGTKCGVDPNSGITLCLGITSCPTVLVDPDQLPGCGYRISGSAIDLECLCNDSLCPVGSAASCGDAKALLAEQSAQSVCAGIAEGRCSVVSQSATNAGSNTGSSCDKNCRSECGGNPDCIALCGC